MSETRVKRIVNISRRMTMTADISDTITDLKKQIPFEDITKAEKIYKAIELLQEALELLRMVD